MSWKDRLRVSPSQADMLLVQELQRRGLMKGAYTQVEICLWKTIPEVFWPVLGVAVYLDSPLHEKDRAMERDERINEALEKLGIQPLRFWYRPPISLKRLAEICDEVQKTLDQKGERTSL